MGDRHPSASGGGRPRVVVVTGASAGVGRATAKVFATKGASLADRYLARTGYEAQLTEDELEGEREGNLFEPVRGDYGARGRFSERAKRRSWQFWLRRRWF